MDTHEFIIIKSVLELAHDFVLLKEKCSQFRFRKWYVSKVKCCVCVYVFVCTYT